MKIKRISIIENDNRDSKEARNIVEEVIRRYDFDLCDRRQSPDLVISIGGDGTFISSLRLNEFNRNTIYCGIHTGHVGFLNDVKVSEIETLFERISQNQYKIETLSIEAIKVVTNERTFSYNAINEVVLRDINAKTIHLELRVNGNHYQYIAGDGVNISTPTGSTAYNLSLGGSLISPSLKILQVLPIAPLPISKHFACLRNSAIIPEKDIISIIPKREHQGNVKLIIDGENIDFDCVKKINITTAMEGIKVLRFNDYDFWERVNRKFLKMEE